MAFSWAEAEEILERANLTPPRGPVPAVGAKDLALACGLGLVVTLGLALAPQARVSGDGHGYLTLLAHGGGEDRAHVLYLPAARAFLGLLETLVGGLGVAPGALLFSAAGMGLGVGATLLLARGLGLTRARSLAAAVLAATAPVLLFYGTMVEVHALHFGLVALGAAVTVLAPWWRFSLAVALAAAGLSASYLAHETSVLLGPGWLLLAGVAAARAVDRRRSLLPGPEPGPARPASSPFALTLRLAPGVVGLALLLTLVVQPMRVRAAGSLGEPGPGSYLDIVLAFAGHVEVGTMLLEGLVLPFGLLLVLAAAGIRQSPRPERVALGALVGVPLLFHLWWRVPEHGGYMLATLPFLAILAARGLPAADPVRGAWTGATRRRRATAVVAVVALAQLALGGYELALHDSILDADQRVSAVLAASGGAGVLVTTSDLGRPIELDLPGVEPVRTGVWMRVAEASGVGPEEFGVHAAELIAAGAAQRPGVSLCYEAQPELLVYRGSAERALPYVEALTRALAERFEFEQHAAGEWRVQRLRLR